MIILPTGEAFGPMPTIKSSDQIIYLHWMRPSSFDTTKMIYFHFGSWLTACTETERSSVRRPHRHIKELKACRSDRRRREIFGFNMVSTGRYQLLILKTKTLVHILLLNDSHINKCMDTATWCPTSGSTYRRDHGQPLIWAHMGTHPDRFTKDFVYYWLVITHISASESQWNFAHATTAMLSWHVQNFFLADSPEH